MSTDNFTDANLSSLSDLLVTLEHTSDVLASSASSLGSHDVERRLAVLRADVEAAVDALYSYRDRTWPADCPGHP